jgi:hypothetical protein
VAHKFSLSSDQRATRMALFGAPGNGSPGARPRRTRYLKTPQRVVRPTVAPPLGGRVGTSDRTTKHIRRSDGAPNERIAPGVELPRQPVPGSRRTAIGGGTSGSALDGGHMTTLRNALDAVAVVGICLLAMLAPSAL